MQVTELFSDPTEQKLVLKRLTTKLTGEIIKIANRRYKKLGPTELVEITPEPITESGGDGAEEMSWAQDVINTFSDRYRMVRVDHQGKLILHEIDPETREIKPADIEQVKAIFRQHIGPGLDLRKADAVVKRVLDGFRCTPHLVIGELSVAPVLFEDQEPQRYCYRRLSVAQTVLEEAPQPFRDLCSMIETSGGANTLALWLGSLLDPESSRIQYLMLYGGGNNGKSTLLDALHTVLGAASLKLSSGDFMNRFGLSDAANKRLLIFDDNNNTSFMSSGDFKRVTGSNTLRVERKGKDACQVRNNVKIIVATNKLPRLVGDHADIRRNIFLKTRQYTGPHSDGWIAQFSAAMPDILRYCYTQYTVHKAKTGSSVIPLGEDVLGNGVGDASLMEEALDFIADQFYTDDEPGAPELAKRQAVRPIDLPELFWREKLDPKVAEVVRDVLHNKYRVMRKSSDRPRAFRGLWRRTSSMLMVE